MRTNRTMNLWLALVTGMVCALPVPVQAHGVGNGGDFVRDAFMETGRGVADRLDISAAGSFAWKSETVCRSRFRFSTSFCART